jgi:hypothetical protein
MNLTKNCLTLAIKYKLRNKKSKIKTHLPEVFSFNLLKIRSFFSYIKYLKQQKSLLVLIIPHFYIVDFNYNYKIEFNENKIIKNKI